MTMPSAPVKNDSYRSQTLELRSSPKQSALGGLLVREYRWGLSGRARFCLLIIVLTFAVIAFLNVYPFLAITERVDTDALVVEGWVHPYAIQVSVEEFSSHSYHIVFTTGGPVAGLGGYVNDYQTAAGVGAGSLKKAGIPADLVQMVPSHVIDRDRTYSSAIALRDWLRDRNMQVRGLNVVTEGAHARRTRLLYEKAFGPGINIGVIAVNNPDFNANRWWHYSEGVEDVIDEGVAYVYAKFFFHPKW
jgi:uncharacterized SAM-binding protein YcdF (DUF218 family)